MTHRPDPGDRAAALLQAAQLLAAARELRDVLRAVRSSARQLTGADGVTAVLREGDLVHYADEDAVEPLWKGQRFPASHCVSGWVLRERRTAVIPDVFADPRVPAALYRPTFVKSMVMVPVRAEDPVAAIGAYWAAPHQATDGEVRTLEALAGLTAVALANVSLLGELRQAVRARDEFLAVAAHELRTPLTPVVLQLGRAQRALERHDVARARQALDHMQASVRRTNALVDELLDLSSAVHAEVVLDRAPVDLSELAEDVVARHRCDGQPPIVLHAPEPVEGLWDRLRLEHVLASLLSNGLKFGGPGGVEVSVQGDGDLAQLTVSDRGIGIAAQDQERIFGRFERAVSMRRYGGLGMGLWLVRRFVEAHGGSVRVRSRPDHGSSFLVVLPRELAVRRADGGHPQQAHA